MSPARGRSIQVHVVGVGLSSLAALGCGADKTGGPKGTGMSASMEITAATGGMVSLEGTTLMVPAGALPADAVITITSSTASPPSMFKSWNSPVFKFEPDGLVFLTPVEVTLEFTGSPASPAVHWSSAASGVENLGGAVSGGRITTSIIHFSEGFVAEGAFDAGIAMLDAPKDGPPDAPRDAPSDSPPDGNDVPFDAGLVPDGGDTPNDAGMAPDGGGSPIDAGTAPDGGGSPIDAGTTPDGGGSTTDAGTAPDGGGSPTDAGTAPDGGASPIDAGTGPDADPAPDASSAPDAGT